MFCLLIKRVETKYIKKIDGIVVDVDTYVKDGKLLMRPSVEFTLEGVIASSEKAEEIREVARKAFSSPEIQNWYSGEWTLFNECAIIYKEKGVLQTRRPDRVMMKDGQVVVVDFKFGKENLQYNKQVKGYMQLLTKMGYKNITGYLWYVDEELIVKVK